MKKKQFYVALSAMGLFLVLVLQPVMAAEDEYKAESQPGMMGAGGARGMRLELTEERIERIMQMLRERAPERAKELEQLRSDKPEAFKKELRETIQQFIERRRQEGAGQGEYRQRPRSGKMEPGGMMGGGMMGGGMAGGMNGRGFGARGRMQEWTEELLGWLDENFPEKAERLRSIQEEHPEHFEKAIRYSLRKYRRIMDASEENPELAEVLKDDMRLKHKRWELIDKIKEAGEEDKKALIEELGAVISQRFDLIIKRKRIAYEHLKLELEALKQKVKEGEKDIENWVKTKDKRVEERVKEVLGKMEEFKWN